MQSEYDVDSSGPGQVDPTAVKERQQQDWDKAHPEEAQSRVSASLSAHLGVHSELGREIMLRNTRSMIALILLVFAFVLAIVAGFVPPAPAPFWGWRALCWSLACYFLADIVTHAGPLLR